MGKQAVLLLAHGTPENIEKIPEYLRNVTGGRPLPHEVVEEIQRRYALIGRSPLTEITQEQGRLVEAELADSGERIPVYVAMRNWHPYITDIVSKMRADGIEEAAVLCMAPQNSRTSIGLYRRVVEATGLRIDFTENWADHPQLIEAFAERLRPAWTKLSAEAGAPVPVLFTAHSVPLRTVQTIEGQAADPYAKQAKRTSSLVAERVPEKTPTMLKSKTHIEENSLYNTPPCFSIYVIALVTRWIRKVGLENLYRQNVTKAKKICWSKWLLLHSVILPIASAGFQPSR